MKSFSNIIYVYKKRNYGRYDIYIKKPEIVKVAVERLTGKKTVDEKDLKALSDLGYTVKQVNATALNI